MTKRSMDVTSVSCGKDTRNRLKEYRDEAGHRNYDEALNELLDLAEEANE